eukprot:scaffold3445_cov80-Skeletonema_marinoi.AAC.12
MHPSAPPAHERINRMNLDDDKTGEELSIDEVAIVFSFLPHRDIMRARVCTTWRDAAKKTLVPLCEFRVDSVRSYNAMRVMATALPNLQQLSIHSLGRVHKYSYGEDPDEVQARCTAHFITHDINIISSFTKLRVLHIDTASDTRSLNRRYPVLFNFPLLHKIVISDCRYLKFDLGMLSSFPLLKELEMSANDDLTGNLRSLRVLKYTLEKVRIDCCRVEGNFMELAHFPRLNKLHLEYNQVTGDIRDIGEGDFLALESLCLPKSVHGGMHYRFRRVSDVPSFMHAIHLLMQRTSKLFKVTDLNWGLSEASPDWYWDGEIGMSPTPFDLRIVQAGSRRGWSWWCSYGPENERHSCEINWLDPEPSSDSSGYETYIEELQRVQRNIDFYRGYYEIPTEDEYLRLCEELPRG